MDFLIVVVIALVVAALAYLYNRKRQEALRAYAEERGWQYRPQDPALVRRWPGPPFGVGSSRRASEVLTGTFHGHQAVSFNYQYTTGSGKNRTTTHFHVVGLHLPAPLPWLRLSPEHFGTRIGKFFGMQDLEFESHAFNDTWRVQGPEGQFPYDFIHPRMMERLMQPDAVGQRITVEGQDIYLHAQGRQQVERIDAYLNLLLGVVQQIPRHLWLRVGHVPLSPLLGGRPYGWDPAESTGVCAVHRCHRANRAPGD